VRDWSYRRDRMEEKDRRMAKTRKTGEIDRIDERD